MFDRELTRARRDGEPVCLMMIDIDNFKLFNDHYGHIAGDRVLLAVADALRDRLRATDLIARFGGDEFAVLLPSLDVTQARGAGERLRQRILELSPPSLSTAITISIGVCADAAGDDVNSLVQRADEAMYAAKTRGRNRIEVRGESDADVVD